VTRGERHREGETRVRLSQLRVRLEIALALAAGALGIVTIFWHDWIEALTGWDPDSHNGGVEWIVVAVLLAAAVALGLAARHDRKLLRASPGK
jgi:hypothetical protein